MKRALDRFILSIPTLFIKQYPYAWIVAVALWSWPLNISAVLFLIVAFGVFSLNWREAAWISEMRRQHAPKTETFYVDRPRVPMPRAVRNLAILVAVSVATAWIVGGRLSLSFWQAFVMFSGFGLFYLDTLFFGPVAIYIVTGGGIAIYYIPGHTDYRIFLRFNEMGQIVRMDRVETRPVTWSVISRNRDAKSGILLVPRYTNGFTRVLDGEILLTPTNVDEFLKHIPSTLITDKR